MSDSSTECFTDPQFSNTFPEFVRAAAAAYGDANAIERHTESSRDALTFNQLDEQSAEIARGLLARGVGKGSRVGFILGNSPKFALVFAAIARIGAIAVPISTLIKSKELVRVLRQTDISGLIVQRSLLGKDYIERIYDALPELANAEATALRLPELPYLRWIVSGGDELPAAVSNLQWLKEGAATVSDELLRAVEKEVHTTDQLMEIYTSGSMAMPKGVKHNHGPTLFRTHYIRSKLPIQRGMQLPATLPMFWVGGLMMSLMVNWEVGATTACTEGTSTNSQMAMGSVLAADDLKEYPQGMTIWALGMTETLGPYSYGDQMRVEGYPLCPPLDHIADRYDVRVADENDQPVADGEVGEIQVRGYALTPGLHKMERDGYFTADGYYHTGDLGERNGDQILFVGRDGDMIKTANSNVSPAEVELEMQEMEGIHSAYVVGIPDKERGQLVVAAVVPREGATLDFDAIEKELRQNLSSYKVPRAYIAITREEVPMLPSNKVARRQIETMMVERLGR